MNIFKNNFRNNLYKGKMRKNRLYNMYEDLILLYMSTQFTYDTPDFNSNLYERAILTGCGVFYKCDQKSSVNYGKWCCTPAEMADVRDNSGITRKIITHGSDYAQELTVDKDCVLIPNNSLYLPEYTIINFAEMLTECDLSSLALTKWSRMTPIPKVRTDEQKAAMLMTMQSVLDGDELNVLSDNIDLLTDEHKTIDDNMYRLTDENAIEKMHFYSEYHEQILKRMCTYRGVPFTSNAKSAQSLIAELHDEDIFSMAYIKDCYNARKKAFEKCAELSGHDFKFDYSDYMKMQFDSIKAEQKTAENVSRETVNNGGDDNGNMGTEKTD